MGHSQNDCLSASCHDVGKGQLEVDVSIRPLILAADAFAISVANIDLAVIKLLQI